MYIYIDMYVFKYIHIMLRYIFYIIYIICICICIYYMYYIYYIIYIYVKLEKCCRLKASATVYSI